MTAVDDRPNPSLRLSHAMSAEASVSLSATFKALSDPLRLRMLSAIANDERGESCVCDLAELTDVSQPTVSHHLKVLKSTGLLTSVRRGTWVWYSIEPGRKPAVTALLDGFAATALATRTSAAVSARIPVADPEIDSGDIDRGIEALGRELAGDHPNFDPELVLSIVRESFVGLSHPATGSSQMLPRTKRFSQQRLEDMRRRSGSSRGSEGDTANPGRAPQVLFVCVANAGRSQLAAALVDRLSNGSIVARSAGSRPAAEVDPAVRALLQDIEGGAAGARFPKPLTDDAVRAADVVVTMGCGDVCPVIPGIRYLDWAVGDPALASAAGVETIRQDIETRVRTLVSELTHSKAGIR